MQNLQYFGKIKKLQKNKFKMGNQKNIKKLIYKLNDIELQIKKNFNNSINLITDFIIYQSSSKKLIIRFNYIYNFI